MIQLAHQRGLHVAHRLRLVPGGIVEAGGVPAGGLHAGVVVGAHIEIGVAHRRFDGQRFPALVGQDELLLAVLIGHGEGGHQRQPVAEHVALILQRQIAAIPAVRQGGGDGVFARAQQRGHVPGLILQALLVAGPAGAQHVRTHRAAVQPQGIDAQRRGVDAGAADGLVLQDEGFSQPRGRLHL